MVELYGWATIRESYHLDSEEDNIHNIEIRIKSVISKYDWLSDSSLGAINFGFQNGELALTVSLHANRYRQEAEDIFDLYRYIAKIAAGSYGLLYLHDDENVNGKDNEFQIFVLKKGIIMDENDPFLSPIIPSLEDEYS